MSIAAASIPASMVTVFPASSLSQLHSVLPHKPVPVRPPHAQATISPGVQLVASGVELQPMTNVTAVVRVPTQKSGHERNVRLVTGLPLRPSNVRARSQSYVGVSRRREKTARDREPARRPASATRM
jgi:hypothetical protein